SSAACRMSSKHFLASSCIHEGPRRCDGFKKIMIANRAGHHEVDWTRKKHFQSFAKAEVCIGMFAFRQRLKLDKKIEVTCCEIKAIACRGAEELQPLHAKAAAELGELSSMLFDERVHIRIAA